jgi:hypothetical protein
VPGTKKPFRTPTDTRKSRFRPKYLAYYSGTHPIRVHVSLPKSENAVVQFSRRGNIRSGRATYSCTAAGNVTPANANEPPPKSQREFIRHHHASHKGSLDASVDRILEIRQLHDHVIPDLERVAVERADGVPPAIRGENETDAVAFLPVGTDVLST